MSAFAGADMLSGRLPLLEKLRQGIALHVFGHQESQELRSGYGQAKPDEVDVKTEEN